MPAKHSSRHNLLLTGLNIICVTAALALTLSNQPDIQQMRQETTQLTTPAEVQDNDQIHQLQNEIDDIYQQLDHLLTALQTERQYTQRVSPTISANLTKPAPGAPSVDQPNSSSQENTVFKQLAAKGYLTLESWNQAASIVENLPKDENKAFWESMNAALANGDLQILIPDNAEG
ncbi:hypothetical protein [Hahella ganghwensis]|uniref:hypothetical protein n=1 Tax=Hahella ganghwensis TaxID=286420 RepID=UPI00037563C9|nr:hypothetical protein [Hahella ganghwensis]